MGYLKVGDWVGEVSRWHGHAKCGTSLRWRCAASRVVEGGGT